MAIGGLPGGSIDRNLGGAIRPPAGGVSGAARPGAPGQGIANGSVVEGLVTSASEGGYMVRIGGQMLSARSTIPLFVGQRFRAVWDSTSMPPTLKLQSSDMQVLSRFSGRDQQIAFSLLSRGLPVNDQTLLPLRQAWLSSGGDPNKLGVMAELWARGLQMTDANISLFSWYMGLTPEQASQIWKRIKEKMDSRRYDSPADLLEALRDEGDDEEMSRFMKAHAMAGKPARRGLDPTLLLAPAWWPVSDGDSGGMARVSISYEEERGVRVSWMNFEMECDYLDLVRGDAMTNERAISANIRMRREDRIPEVEAALPELREELSSLSLPIQRLAVGPLRDDKSYSRTETVGLDMEV